MKLRDAVQRIALQAVEQHAASWFLASVTAVNEDGTVDISTARGPVPGVRRLKSYSAPAVNDVVKVSRNSDGNWVVDGALA
ncbi:hypothetical protein [Streptomyces sp. SID5910]|uniref:hypothetical protein n=1 Tax=Streptomyces sp. SID5910 TaxID=2690312 RepID=UPI0013A979E0|nr:hypothetical protein [Streptomyces sp. SID5910]MYR43071.1 hypothetical protein [Streptomyces sp. SID5910]